MPESTEARHPIRVVAQRTGLSTPVLRAWERRYSAVEPTRSDGGQRLYSDADIRRLQLLATAVDGGRSIGLIAGLGIEELESLIDGARKAPVHVPGGAVAPDVDRVERALEYVRDLKVVDLEDYLMRAAVELRPHELVEGLMVPLLQEIGREWQSGWLPKWITRRFRPRSVVCGKDWRSGGSKKADCSKSVIWLQRRRRPQ